MFTLSEMNKTSSVAEFNNSFNTGMEELTKVFGDSLYVMLQLLADLKNSNNARRPGKEQIDISSDSDSDKSNDGIKFIKVDDKEDKPKRSKKNVKRESSDSSSEDDKKKKNKRKVSTANLLFL